MSKFQGEVCQTGVNLENKGTKHGFGVGNGTAAEGWIDQAACMVIGVVNGVLVGKFKLPPFIGTLGTMTIGRGIAQIVNGNYNTGDIGQGAAETFRNIFYYGKTLGIYNGVWITLVVVCVLMDIVRSNGKLKPGKENK